MYEDVSARGLAGCPRLSVHGEGSRSSFIFLDEKILGPLRIPCAEGMTHTSAQDIACFIVASPRCYFGPMPKL